MDFEGFSRKKGFFAIRPTPWRHTEVYFFEMDYPIKRNAIA
jgi:hypothetical protein